MRCPTCHRPEACESSATCPYAGLDLRSPSPYVAPQGFAADTDPPYGDDSGPDNPEYEPIRLPWECVEDDHDRNLGQARVLNDANDLVCTTTPRRARLIVSLINRHASGWDV